MEELPNIKREYTIIDTEDEAIVKSHKAYIELTQEYLKQVLDYRGFDKEDEDKKENDVYNKLIVDKYAISGICLYKVVAMNNWCVECQYGRSNSITVQFKEFSDAKLLHGEIVKWRYE